LQDDDKGLLKYRIYILAQTFLALLLPAIMIPLTCPIYLFRGILRRIRYAPESGSRTTPT